MNDRQLFNIVLDWPKNSDLLSKHVSHRLNSEQKGRLLAPFLEEKVPAPALPKAFSFNMDSDSDSDVDLVLNVNSNEFDDDQIGCDIDTIEITIPSGSALDELSDISDTELQFNEPFSPCISDSPMVIFIHDFSETECDDLQITVTTELVDPPKLSRNRRKRLCRRKNRSTRTHERAQQGKSTAPFRLYKKDRIMKRLGN